MHFCTEITFLSFFSNKTLIKTQKAAVKTAAHLKRINQKIKSVRNAA